MVLVSSLQLDCSRLLRDQWLSACQVTGRRGKRGGGPSPDRGSPHQRWSALSQAASDSSFPAAAGQPQFPPQPPHLPAVAIGEQPPSAMPKIPLEQNNALQQPQPQDEVIDIPGPCTQAVPCVT